MLYFLNKAKTIQVLTTKETSIWMAQKYVIFVQIQISKTKDAGSWMFQTQVTDSLTRPRKNIPATYNGALSYVLATGRLLAHFGITVSMV
jgi:hypothetical protein